MNDIYFERSYGELYEKLENGVCEIFEYKSSLGHIHHLYMKREIPIYSLDKVYFDIVTPYGYGGPLIIDCKESDKENLIQGFKKEFQNHCNKNDIISEFVRFHPVVENGIEFQSIYKVEKDRKTVGTNIFKYEDPVMSEFSKSTRKTIRQILNMGISYKVTKKPNFTDISEFKNIYYSTMDRNKATDYYYFNDEYFENCLKNFKENIILVEVFLEGKVIAAGFYFVYADKIHAHLSGTLKDYLQYSPAYIIKYATVKWAQENSVKLIHYGGGTTKAENDPLYLFKKKFGKNTEFDFYTGKKVWNTEIYEKMCKELSLEGEVNYFPKYRYQLNEKEKEA